MTAHTSTRLPLVAVFGAALLIVPACSQTDDNTSGPQDSIATGLIITHSDGTSLSGTYGAAGLGIRFESLVEGDQKFLRFADANGAELVRVELGNTQESLRMWHYGAPQSVTQEAETSQGTVDWLESDEAQLVASLWREFLETEIETHPAAAVIQRYSLHTDEVLGKLVAEATEGAVDDAEHRCSDCPGKCGPGCWSVGSNSYCENHDCCCDHYGGWACYTWCYVNPKCNHKSPC